MRLSEWRKAAPTREAMSNKVLAVLKPVLADLGAEDDPECWVAWGDDPSFRYSVMAPTLVGLITVGVRLSSGEEGPRATAKLIRWSKLSVSELGIEASGGHRIVAVQLEGQVIKGMDEEADLICEFVRGLIAAVDNRNPVAVQIPVATGAGRPRLAEPTSAAAASTGTSAPRPKAVPKAVAPKRLRVVRPAKADGPPAADEKTTAKQSAPKAVPAVPVPPKPIAARKARRQAQGSDGAPKGLPAGPVRVEPEPDRSQWIGPHPIEEAPAREPNKPRPWTP